MIHSNRVQGDTFFQSINSWNYPLTAIIEEADQSKDMKCIAWTKSDCYIFMYQTIKFAAFQDIAAACDIFRGTVFDKG